MFRGLGFRCLGFRVSVFFALRVHGLRFTWTANVGTKKD